MAEYAKAFSYDARGFGSKENLKEKIDSDVAAYLVTVGATHFNDITISSNDSNVIVMILCDDAL